MSSRYRSVAHRVVRLAVTLLAGCARPPHVPPRTALRVCADPNNLPFSDLHGDGLENRLADLVARDLGIPVQYTWWAQRRGFLRNTLRARTCDVVMGLPTALEQVATTAPYYRSTYVFVSRHDHALDMHSLDDPRLRTLRVGVQLIGDDGANTPPVHALALRGIVDNVVGFSAVGDYEAHPPGGAIVDAVLAGAVDVAIVWGPLAGYFLAKRGAPLDLVPLEPAREGPFPFTFAISMGVRRGDTELRARLDAILARRHPEIDALLASYGVPRR